MLGIRELLTPKQRQLLTNKLHNFAHSPHNSGQSDNLKLRIINNY
ncbi:hypothetical protein NIES23_42280 [Trichormus variabilis NIES-23]|uniref:Uncharacterized protein n=1 Tax=Trichormus variabilis NIES-23 TaxID=1973479 RepID=A0A1Z4KQY9_ANAVA|nr:hypothetical protein NIES23_42280 [Trichormus variabilis NIES-23]